MKNVNLRVLRATSFLLRANPLKLENQIRVNS